MGDHIKNNSSAEHTDRLWVLALEAPSRSDSSMRPHKRRKMKPHVNETNNEGMLGYTLNIDQGQDIEEKILTHLQNSIKSSEYSKGHARMGTILSATGSVLKSRMDAENSSASDKDSYAILSLGGRYIISEDGQVQQDGRLIISCAGPSCVAYGGHVFGRLVAAEPVQVVVGISASK